MPTYKIIYKSHNEEHTFVSWFSSLEKAIEMAEKHFIRDKGIRIGKILNIEEVVDNWINISEVDYNYLNVSNTSIYSNITTLNYESIRNLVNQAWADTLVANGVINE